MLQPARKSITKNLLLIAALLSLSAFAGSKEQDQLTYQNPTRNLASPGEISFLTGPNSGEPLDIAMGFLRANTEALGFTSSDLDNALVRDQYTSRKSGTTHIYLDQYVDGIQIYHATIGIHIAHDGSVIKTHSSFIQAAGNRVAGEVRKQASDAATLASTELGYKVATPFAIVTQQDSPQRQTQLNDGGFARENVNARLVYKAVNAHNIRPVWLVNIKEKGAQHDWFVGIDAEDGRTLVRRDGVIADRFEGPGDVARNAAMRPPAKKNKLRLPDQYEVLEMPKEYPYDGPRTVAVDPAHPNGSPHGWHDTDGVAGAEFTITRGNNTHSFLDRDNNDTPDPGADVDGGATLDFTGPLVPFDLALEPNTYSNAAVVNLFYWVNTIHDVLYEYGFDEDSGNFQVNNYGHGGAGNDDVIAYCQKGADVGQFNNAFFGTPADGSRPEMLMLEWNNTTPNRDGDFSSGIMAHEFGHGVSNRLTGGPTMVSCLGNSEQMGEGWSDFMGLVFTAKDTDTDVLPRGIGTYALGQPDTGPGIRPARYSTDMVINGFTYADISGQAVPHGVGFVWCSMLWEVYWALTTEYGFNPDFYADHTTGGNNLAIQLVLDGMKLQPCSPGFVDGRDGILAADMALTGGENQCLIWAAFAKRGLGFSADQGSSASTSDGTEAFDIPVTCDTFGPVASTVSICSGSDAVFDLSVGSAWAGPVTFSASGEPAGSTVTFSPNPLPTFPGTVTMTVSNTGGVPFGSSTISITGTDGSVTEDADVTLNAFDAVPTTPGLVAPANGMTDVASSPTLTWTVGTQNLASTVEIASDAGFNNVVFTTMGSGTSATSTRLDSLSTYYWRVKSANPCGDSAWSSTYNFTTLEQPDYFTEAFDGGFDLANRTTYFLPDGSGDFYRLCSEDAMVFPTDPAGGNQLTLADDDSQMISLATPIALYGVSYSGIYVGSNGYLTFGASDTAYTETLAAHFSLPRISGLFDDLNPTVGGTVSYLELVDRVVVTYQGISEFNTTNSNNFQFELFFTGDLVITHLGIDASDGITGLSAGTGTPGDYLPSELSGSGGCVVVIPCPADLNGDMTVDASDRGVMISGWGIPNSSHDVNGDGLVNVSDILIIETLYGACP